MSDKEQCLIWLNESITRSAIRILSNQASNNCGVCIGVPCLEKSLLKCPDNICVPLRLNRKSRINKYWFK